MDAAFLLNLLWQVCVLGLVALGLAIMFGQLRILNMAHGELVMIGAYSPIMAASLGLPYWLSLPICITVVGVVAWIMEVGVVSRLYDRPFDSLLATWGISIALRELIEVVFGREFQSVPAPVEGTVSLGGVEYPAYRLAAMVVIFAFFALLGAFYSKTDVGLRIRAMVSNPVLANAAGIDCRRLARWTFVFASVTAGLAGLVLAPTTQVEPMMGLDYLVRSFFSVIVGGLGSLQGLGLGVTAVATTQSTLSTLFDQTAGYLGVLILSVIFLWVRPHGLRRAS